MKQIGIIIGDISRSRGTERAATNLANMLSVSKKYQVTIISCFTNNNQESYYTLENSVNIIHCGIEKKGFVSRITHYFTFYKKLISIIKQYKIDIFIGTTHAFNIIISFFHKRLITIGCEHMKYYACPIYSRIIRRIRYQFLDAVVVLTERDGKNYRFLNKEVLYNIPNSLSFTVDEPAKLINKRILAVGGLSYEKGYDELVIMAKTIKKQLPDWHIDIFGEGEEKENLLKQIKKLSLDDYITFHLPTKNIREEYLQSSIYVLTSRFECFPMVLLEAQECGVPVVAFDCEYGPSDLVDDDSSGFLIENRNYDDFVAKLIKLAINSELRKEFGLNAKKNAYKYNSIEIFKKWDNLINILIIKKQN